MVAEGLKKLTLELGENVSSLSATPTQKALDRHGADKDTTMGSSPHWDVAKAIAQISDVVELGDRIVLGGKPAEGLLGYFFPPTISTHMASSMQFSHEQAFAYISALYSFSTEAEVVKAANSTSMGLAS
ncbi:hypothetical protein MMC16_007763 [Acarospora aff. strigata]|nr:hypothetical protein [Acarospora aff. strigata]